ncbi:PWWP domain-containing protein 5-like [Cornus florida]|uniref:PWWP domain-containing protein 5-like n=1 Tax=Cornus florida TaxID=4283 RepID=UPI00289D5411|nr:PWWP domain-containing protein 5-like [Cornus florida]
MSLKLDGIDLNSEVSVERDNEVYGVNASELALTPNVSVTETLTERPGVDGCSVEGVSGGIRVSREVKGSVEAFHAVDRSLIREGIVSGLVGEGFEGRNESVDKENDWESDRGNDGKGADALLMPVTGVPECEGAIAKGKIAEDDNGVVLGLKNDARSNDAACENLLCSQKNGVNENFSTFLVEPVVDRRGENISARADEAKVADTGDSLYKGDENVTAYGSVAVDELLSILEMQTNTRIDTDENQVIGIRDSEAKVFQHTVDQSDTIGLLDLNLQIDGDGNQKSGNVISKERTKFNEFSGDVDIPFSACSADELSLNDGVGLNENQDVVNTEHVTDVEQLQDIEKKNDRPADLKSEFYRKGCRTEKEGEFYASDLVWGKVRSHPWWPGQIFDPSDSSEKARKYHKKDGFLIAYFGDQTFAWNEASRIKPFRSHFTQMEKQSTMETFCHAVGCALDEVSRRVEFGLACSCLSEEVYSKIKSQIIVNAGIREESSLRDGGDEFSSLDSFNPVNLVQYLKELAPTPYSGTDRLEFVIARAQLLALNRHKGFYQLPEFKMLGGLLENDVNILSSGESEDSDEVVEDSVPGSKDNELVPSGKGKSIKGNSSRKRKQISVDVMYPSKKEKSISDLMSGSHTKFSNDENKPKRKAGRKSISSSGKKRKAVESISDDTTPNTRKSLLSAGTSRPFRRIGESIRKAARELDVSSPIFKHGSERTSGEKGSNEKPPKPHLSVPPHSSKESKRRKVIPAENPPPDEMLSQLYLVAKDPLKRCSFLIQAVGFFSDFRNSLCLQNSNSQKQKKSTGNASGEQTGKQSSKSETTETFGFEGMEDSYWTDRIVQNSNEEQVLFEPETPNGKSICAVETDAPLQSSLKSDSKQGITIMNHESGVGKPAGHMDGKFEQQNSPTALVLNFMDLDAVPSEKNLNKIFSRYGPLNELETEVLKKSSRAKVVFKRRSDAETAFSSAGKFSIFGPSLVSYRLNYSPTPRKTPTSARKGRRNDDSTSVAGNEG